MTDLRTATKFCLKACVIVLALASGSASAQDSTYLGDFNDWSAYKYHQNNGFRCTMVAKPTKDEGDYTKRGAIWAFVLHRPAEGAAGEVGFYMGYPVKDGSTVDVTIGGQSFKMFTSGEGAFAWPEDEPKLIAAMRRGATMVVKGTSARGTATTDTYSLSGFTAAKAAIDKGCDVR